MRLLADQNVPRDTVDALRGGGHDVVWVQETYPGANDRTLLQHAEEQDRIVLTFDKDFGELAFHAGLPASCGIILVRATLSAPPNITRLVVRALQTRTDWAGQFSIVEDTRIRMRPLPT
ncbi:MAG: hypothetical protein GVY18_08680 [Bacteroidetes bacterium]|jgi:predicted nuclease of predicted toxin-antitoxin system|nr:hypothetical protein [Bacteroidota bacterium]